MALYQANYHDSLPAYAFAYPVLTGPNDLFGRFTYAFNLAD
jgi:hypothetical protein